MSVRARLGVPGYLFAVPGVTALSDSLERASSTRTTLGGVRVVQEAVRAHRTWAVTLRPGSRPQDLAPIVALAEGEWGRGPFRFVSEWAQVTNLLTPRASLLDVKGAGFGWTEGGPVMLGDGSLAGRQVYRHGGGSSIILPRAGGQEESVPVIPGIPVTASVYATGLAAIRLRWLDANGTLISEDGPVDDELGLNATRLSITRTPPAGAALAQMRVTVELNRLIARPAITWTPRLMPYYPGSGVARVRVTGLGHDVRAAWLGDGGQRAGLSFTVEEVG